MRTHVISLKNENVLDTAAFQVGTDACVEARRLVFGYPGAEDLLLTFHVYAQHRIHAFRDNFVILAGIKHDPIEENHRVDCFKRTILPLVYLRQNLVGYSRNKSL